MTATSLSFLLASFLLLALLFVLVASAVVATDVQFLVSIQYPLGFFQLLDMPFQVVHCSGYF